MRLSDIHLRAISQCVPQLLFCIMSLKIRFQNHCKISQGTVVNIYVLEGSSFSMQMFVHSGVVQSTPTILPSSITWLQSQNVCWALIKLSKGTPLLTINGELWGVYCDLWVKEKKVKYGELAFESQFTSCVVLTTIYSDHCVDSKPVSQCPICSLIGKLWYLQHNYVGDIIVYC